MRVSKLRNAWKVGIFVSILIVIGLTSLRLLWGKNYVVINGIKFYVEVADTPEKREIGLMFRKELGRKEGMFFVFDRPQVLHFWMKNTFIPLDIIFIDSERKIINIETLPALSSDICKSDGPAMYVLELYAGSCSKYRIKPGMKVEFHIGRE